MIRACRSRAQSVGFDILVKQIDQGAVGLDILMKQPDQTRPGLVVVPAGGRNTHVLFWGRLVRATEIPTYSPTLAGLASEICEGFGSVLHFLSMVVGGDRATELVRPAQCRAVQQQR